MKTILHSALLALLLVGVAQAQPMPPGPPGPPGSPPPPSPEMLATIPDLTAAQQFDIRKILIERRDADEALQNKMRSEFDALRLKQRSEHERIEEQSAERLRKLLGEEGYRHFAQWQVGHRGPPGMGPGAMHPPMGAHAGHPGGPRDDDKAPPPPRAAQGAAPPFDDNEE